MDPALRRPAARDVGTVGVNPGVAPAVAPARGTIGVIGELAVVKAYVHLEIRVQMLNPAAIVVREIAAAPVTPAARGVVGAPGVPVVVRAAVLLVP